MRLRLALAPAWVLALGLALALALGTSSAHATEARALAADPALEARVMLIAQELRCLVCQNQTIADSNADLALDLRQQIRERLQRGESTAAILAFMTDRYGDYVLYRPPLKATTALLWAGPFVLLLLGLAGLARHIRQHRRAAAGQTLSEAEAARARQLLGSLPGPL